MRSGQVLFDPAKIDRWGCGGGTEVLAIDLSTECMLLQVVKPRCALDIGQCLGLGDLQPLEHLAATDCPLELPDKLFQMVLHNPVQVDQVAVHIVQHLDRGGRAQEVDRGTSAKHLYVALMLGEQGNQSIGQPALAAEPGNDG